VKLPELLNTARLYFNLDLSQYFNEAGFDSPAYLKALSFEALEAFDSETFFDLMNNFIAEINKGYIEDEPQEPRKRTKNRTYYQLIIDTIYLLTKIKIDYQNLTYQDASYLLYAHNREEIIKAIYKLYKYVDNKKDSSSVSEYDMLRVDTKNLEEMTVSQMQKLHDNWKVKIRTRNVR